MDGGVHGPGPYFDGPGPWTGPTEGVHGPGVHVLYFPRKIISLTDRYQPKNAAQ